VALRLRDLAGSCQPRPEVDRHQEAQQQSKRHKERAQSGFWFVPFFLAQIAAPFASLLKPVHNRLPVGATMPSVRVDAA
jgi:hypothetical protein